MNTRSIGTLMLLAILLGVAGYMHYHVPKRSVFLTPTAYIYGEINDTILMRIYWIGTDSKEYSIIKDSNLTIAGLDNFATLKKFEIKETVRYNDNRIKALTLGIYLKLKKTGIHKGNVTLIIENEKENYRKEVSMGSWVFEIAPRQDHLLKITDMIDLEIGPFNKNVSPECMFAVKNTGDKIIAIEGVQHDLQLIPIEKITYVNASSLDEINENTIEIPLPEAGLYLRPNESKVIIVHFKREDFRYPRKPVVIRFKIIYRTQDKTLEIPTIFTYEVVPLPSPKDIIS
ncbi:hypothetical protein PNA2_1440 [Pyrococcus sp. NA2]|uniref:hypothetical protein n=1 Tax=Pyrococcus sp. (strain NA2) TaxID=342949 RepID=UPI000209AF30|nr:hypothetical protein [Pyrococcus sp. NA2]AEC52354.1 hypothetical protein PNA2_1440 [Pyrococcus sp. NA2]